MGSYARFNKDQMGASITASTHRMGRHSVIEAVCSLISSKIQRSENKELISALRQLLEEVRGLSTE